MCGIFAVYNNPVSPKIAYIGIRNLQHRGQEGAGILTLQGNSFRVVKGLGQIDYAIPAYSLLSLKGEISIAHTRYSTSGDLSVEALQPYVFKDVAIAFNGTITNYRDLARKHSLELKTNTDTELIAKLFYKFKENEKEKEAMKKLMEELDGGYSIIALTNKKIIYARDEKGIRPLLLGKLGSSFLLSSEDVAINAIGGEVLREIRAGEIGVIDDKGLDKLEGGKTSAFCSFEYIYFARPDSIIEGKSVYEVRVRLGEILGKNHPAKGNIVVPVPDTGRPYAIGYSKSTGIPIEEGIYRSVIALRTFIENDGKRDISLSEKFSPIRKAIEGKSVVLIDDSIVRGNTMRRIVNAIKESGANEVHVRVGSPMIRFPCYMGIDFPTYEELIANRVKDIAREINADSLEYLTISEMREIMEPVKVCDACFSGNYPLRRSYNFRELYNSFTR
jgi:amidophosphoribosyltransferase